jgi:uncharacterized protein with FMN-binding domain
MRRAFPVIAATAGGLALVAGFHTHPAGTALASGPAAQTSPPEPTTTTPTTSAGRPSSPSAGRATTSTTAAVTTSTRTIDGPIVTNDYGDVQVRVTFAGTRISDVQALKLPSDRARSVRISQYSAPRLRAEALQAQSANIDLVSGASYTSQSYIDSLQGALDLAHR